MVLFKKKSEKTEEQKKQELKEIEPVIEELNVGKEQKPKEMTLDEVISKNTEAWYRAQIITLLSDLNMRVESLSEQTNQLIEEIKKK